MFGDIVRCTGTTDMVIEADREQSNSVALILRGFDVPCFVLYSREGALQFVIPFEALAASGVLKSPLSDLPDLAEAIDRHLRRTLRSQNGIYVLLHEGLRIVPYSLADDGERVNVPVRPEVVSSSSLSRELYSGGSGIPARQDRQDACSTSYEALLSDEARALAIGTIERTESFIPPDAGEKAARFLREVIL